MCSCLQFLKMNQAVTDPPERAQSTLEHEGIQEQIASGSAEDSSLDEGLLSVN
jgi:hypothetical protein